MALLATEKLISEAAPFSQMCPKKQHIWKNLQQSQEKNDHGRLFF